MAKNFPKINPKTKPIYLSETLVPPTKLHDVITQKITTDKMSQSLTLAGASPTSVVWS